MTRAATLKLNTYRSLLLYTLIGMCGFLMLAYGALLNATIERGVAIEHAESQIADLSTKLGKLEQSYFNAKQSVTLSTAANLGLGEPSDSLYLSRTSASGLSLSNR